MNEKQIEFTILMPCLNEEKTIGFCINEAMRYIAENKLSAEVLIADNGSTDGSARLAQELGARIIRVENKGYGNAIIGGIKAANGRYIIMGDCDKSYDFYHIDSFVKELRNGYELVMGNRFKGGMEKGAMSFSHRYIGVPILSFIGRHKYKTFVGDFHCGIRGFVRDKALNLDLHCGGMEFATEIIGKFAVNGYSIKEIPVVLRRDGRDGRSHLNSLSDGWRHLKYMIIS